VLADQNKKLEDELEQFVKCDDQIKQQLSRSRSPPKMRAFTGANDP
jgi:hypothetical protein